MGKYGYDKGPGEGISCGQIIFAIVLIAVALSSHFFEAEKKVEKQAARVRQKGISVSDKVMRNVASSSDDYLYSRHPTPSAINIIDKKTGRSLLHMLCELNRFELLEKYLSEGAWPDPRDHQGRTPLNRALYHKSSESVALLLKHKADMTAVDKSSESILHLAAQSGYYEAAKEALRAGAKIDSKAYGFTPLHSAAFKGHLRIVVLLCENGAETQSTVPQGWTAGDLAFGKYPEIVKYLTTHKAAFSREFLLQKYELVDGWPFLGYSEITHLPGNHPAFLAVRADSPDQLAELDRQMTELDITNKAGTPLLILAIANHKFAAASYLVGYTRKIKETDPNGKNALMHALEAGNKDISRKLIKRDIRLDHLDSGGNSALHYAVARCDNDLVAEMIEKGADIFAINFFARGMMHAAAENSNEFIFPTLITNGCDVNQEDIKGNTALHLAAQTNNTRIMQALLTNGADFSVRNLAGKLPVDLATAPEAVLLLRNRFEIEGENPANRVLPAEVRTLTTPSTY